MAEQRHRRSPVDWMPPKQGLERIIELFALGAIRAAQDEGPVQSDTIELPWIKRIEGSSAKGYSSEQIAKQLNKEDNKNKRARK